VAFRPKRSAEEGRSTDPVVANRRFSTD